MVAAVVAVDSDTEPHAVRGLVSSMLKKREIASSAPRARSYMALVNVTESAEEVRDAYLLRQKINSVAIAESYAERKRVKRPDSDKPSGIVGGPGSTVYREGHNPDIRQNQRGQGAAGGRAAIGSGMYSNPKW